VLDQASEAEAAIVEALKIKPGQRHGELCRTMHAKATTLAQRLKRLESKGAIVRDEAGAWSAL
jgi:DNA-binding HxlR family transcriptional regulator